MPYAVCGESFLPLLDALHDRSRLRLIGCRHEAGAAVTGEATGKLTGQPGICLVSRGPGACHASIGLHTAFQDSTPLVTSVGQVPRSYMGREAQQEIDYRIMLAPLAKWVAQVERSDRIPELVHRAFRTARSGRPGPVVLVLPEDVLEDRTDASDCGPAAIARPHPGSDELAAMHDLLARAERPVMILGGCEWNDQACADIARFAGSNDIPMCCSYRRLDLISTEHTCFVGELSVSTAPAFVRRLREADLVLAVGTRLSEPTTQDYTLLDVPVPRSRLIHVYPSGEEIGNVYRPTIAIQASMSAFAAAIAGLKVRSLSSRSSWARELRHAYVDDSTLPQSALALDQGAIMCQIGELLPRDAIVTLYAGAVAGWPRRFFAYGRPGRVRAPVSGAMNYGIHAGVAACLVHPDRTVLVCVRDGGFTMGEAELATALRFGTKPISLLFNNGYFGSARIHQERRYPGRLIGTDLTNPDFAMLARSYGAHFESVGRTEDFAAAWRRCVAFGGVSMIELQLDREQLSFRVSMEGLKKAVALASKI